MKINVVGTSCSWYKRNNTSFILDDKMLLDVSSGNYKPIIRNIDIFDLNAIFISHLHADHVGDLHIITTRFIRESKKRGRTTKLRVYGQKGLPEQIVELKKIIYGAPDELDLELLKDSIDFIEVKDGMEFEESGYKVKVYKMSHGNMLCFGYSFTDKEGKTISFSADTCRCESLETMLSTSGYAFVDMAGITENPHHLHYEGFAELEKQYPTCKMFPVHTSDPSQEYAEKNNMNFLHDGQILNL